MGFKEESVELEKNSLNTVVACGAWVWIEVSMEEGEGEGERDVRFYGRLRKEKGSA